MLVTSCVSSLSVHTATMHVATCIHASHVHVQMVSVCVARLAKGVLYQFCSLDDEGYLICE